MIFDKWKLNKLCTYCARKEYCHKPCIRYKRERANKFKSLYSKVKGLILNK